MKMPDCIFLAPTFLVFLDIGKTHLFLHSSAFSAKAKDGQLSLPFFTGKTLQFLIISVALCWILCRMSMSCNEEPRIGYSTPGVASQELSREDSPPSTCW